MMNDLFKIVIDPVLAPRSVPDPSRPNNFELIYKETNDALGPPVNKRRSFSLDLCYPVPALKPFIGKVKIKDGQHLPMIAPAREKEEKPEKPEKIPIERANSTVNIGIENSRSKSIGSNPMYRTLIRAKLKQKDTGEVSRERSSTSHRRHTSVDDGQQQLRRRGSFASNDDKIPELEEEDKDSDGGGLEEEVRVKRKNYLCRNLVEQTRELCFTNSAVYKDFDKIFDKIINKFQYWELFDKEEIMHAGQALKIIANSGQIVNLVQEKQMTRLTSYFSNEEMELDTRVSICQAFIIIAKNKGLRKIFFQRDLLNMLFSIALQILEDRRKRTPSNRVLLITTTIKLLCIICTVQKTQYYVPGETNLQERLRKRSFDSGLFSILQHIYNELNDVEIEPFSDVKKNI